MSGWAGTGAVLAAIGVGLGAFGAHGLRERIGPDLLATYETGVRYHMYHALALLAVGWTVARGGGTWAHVAGWAFVGGIVVFSGSLYVLAVTGIRWLGAITPVGGLAFLAGWVALAVATLKRGTG